MKSLPCVGDRSGQFGEKHVVVKLQSPVTTKIDSNLLTITYSSSPAGQETWLPTDEPGRRVCSTPSAPLTGRRGVGGTSCGMDQTLGR